MRLIPILALALLGQACSSPAPVRPLPENPRGKPVLAPAQPAARAPTAAAANTASPGVRPAAGTATPAAPVGGRSVLTDLAAYRLAAGDTVRIDVFNEDSLSLSALIEPGGAINYPLLGRIPAAGLGLRELEANIAAGLRNGYLVKPDVRVTLAQFRPIFITGQVRRAGAYPYALGLTVEKALTLAGGMTDFASTRKIYLQREGQTQAQKERVGLDAAVYPGDTLLVEERLF